jgi:hypothetical protein
MTVEKVDDKKKIQTNENGQESTRTDIHTYIHSSMIMNDPAQESPESSKSSNWLLLAFFGLFLATFDSK